MIKLIEKKAKQINTAAIAQHLNIAKDAILRIEEWKKVLFVVCRRLGARFVSKKVGERMKLDDRIPKTLQEAKDLSGVRFHAWSEDARMLVQEILSAGRQVSITSHVDPIGVKAGTLADTLNETRIRGAIAKIAVALGGKVENYD